MELGTPDLTLGAGSMGSILEKLSKGGIVKTFGGGHDEIFHYTPSRQDPAPRPAVIDTSAKKKELQLAPRVRSGVLNEFRAWSLARFNGLSPAVPGVR